MKVKRLRQTIKEEEILDKPSDIYSTGVILFRLFSNRQGSNRFDLTQNQKSSQFGKILILDKSDYAHLGERKATEVCTVIAQCLKENPADRIEVGALVQELENLVNAF